MDLCPYDDKNAVCIESKRVYVLATEPLLGQLGIGPQRIKTSSTSLCLSSIIDIPILKDLLHLVAKKYHILGNLCQVLSGQFKYYSLVIKCNQAF